MVCRQGKANNEKQWLVSPLSQVEFWAPLKLPETKFSEEGWNRNNENSDETNLTGCSVLEDSQDLSRHAF